MLKFILICFLIINACLFAIWRGYLVNPVLEARQPQRLQEQKNAEYLQLISHTVATASTPYTKLNVSDFPNVSSDVEVPACLLWGPFSMKESKQVESKLNAQSLGNKHSRQYVLETVSTRVFIPSLGSKEAANKKAAELTALGVKDFFIVQDSSDLRWGISLGVFKSEKKAKQLLKTLADQGIRSAQLGVYTTASSQFNYVFKTVSHAEQTMLENLKLQFPAQTLQVCKSP